jgi:hypothetical protein
MTMPDDGKSIKSTYTTETPAEVALGIIGLFNSIRESGTALLTKHLDNEATRLRIREIELQVSLKEDSKRGPKAV